MKANELMIGDWIRKGDALGQVVDIEQIEKYATVGVELIGKGYDVYTVNELEPIPLTAEILEKNGFKKDAGGEECWVRKIGWFTPHQYNKKFIPVSWEVEICGMPNSFDGVIKYAHELQHALRLCGIKKEITI